MGSTDFRRGFTLAELIIIVMIVGIVALLALPMMHTALTGMRLSGAAREIAAAIEFAQLSAAGSGRAHRVTVDAAANGLLVEELTYPGDLSPNEVAESVVEQETYAAAAHALTASGLYQIAFSSEPRFDGVDIASAAFGAGAAVVFDALGSPSTGGSVVLTCGGRQITLTLDPSSGKVARSG